MKCCVYNNILLYLSITIFIEIGDIRSYHLQMNCVCVSICADEMCREIGSVFRFKPCFNFNYLHQVHTYFSYFCWLLIEFSPVSVQALLVTVSTFRLVVFKLLLTKGFFL